MITRAKCIQVPNIIDHILVMVPNAFPNVYQFALRLCLKDSQIGMLIRQKLLTGDSLEQSCLGVGDLDKLLGN